MKDAKTTNTEKKLKYVRVYDRLYEMIQNRTYPPGSQLPAENELAQRMEVSRMTLRKALALLQEDGLILNRTGVGSFVNDTAAPRPAGMETIGHPVHRCCTQPLDQVEIALRLEPPTSSITKTLDRKTPAVVIADRWYKSEGVPCAYSLTFLPIEVIGQEGLDLSQPDQLLTYLEETIYQKGRDVRCTLTHSTAGNFTAAQYKLSQHSSFLLIQETIRGADKQVLAASKHYIPIDLFKAELHLTEKDEKHK